MSKSLQKFYRRPKLYINLPSSGQFYAENAINLPENGLIPVFGMTTSDDIIVKTPDALLNGEGTVDIIKSCVPAIVNPWEIPSIDIDAILVAIRIASHGPEYEVEVNIPVVNETRTFACDMRMVLQQLCTNVYDPVVTIPMVSETGADVDFRVFTKPLNHRDSFDTAIQTMTQQKIFDVTTANLNELVANAANFADGEYEAQVQYHKDIMRNCFQEIKDISTNVLAKSIERISIDGEDVTDMTEIHDFITNADLEVCKIITMHITEQREKFKIKPFKVAIPADAVERGAPKSMEVPLVLDPSLFFA